MTTNTSAFFSGWLGIGTGFSAGVLAEPADTAYARRPIQFGPLVGGQVSDLYPGTIGPASSNWGTLLYAGLFDAASGGDLLAVWPLTRPINVGAGQTWTAGGVFGLTVAIDPGASLAVARVWLAGSLFATTRGGQPVTACQNLQIAAGQLVALISGAPVSSTTTTTLSSGSTLPTSSPTSGSGQLWNNGGVICVA